MPNFKIEYTYKFYLHELMAWHRDRFTFMFIFTQNSWSQIDECHFGQYKQKKTNFIPFHPIQIFIADPKLFFIIPPS
jgi:hypothetical protein